MQKCKSQAWDRTPEKNKKEGLIWLMVSEASVHCHLAPLLLGL
jgi:hypothetical protein